MKHESCAIHLVKQVRRLLPYSGGRKLHKMLVPDLRAMDIKLGRDKLFSIIKSHNMLIAKKQRYVTTTNSRHFYRIHTNLLKNRVLNMPNQALVADITYIRTQKEFLYLSLHTDAFSRKILGFDLSNSLSVEGSLRSLKMALKQIKNPTSLIHHSDRGIQYCCHAFTNTLKKHNIAISMAEAGNPYENAIAERINGILKQEFSLDATFTDLTQARAAVSQAIELYNNIRLHTSIGMVTPSEKHAA
jgi:putative transposase